tara:strand:+ start:331 stop:813 length:483 start_codon:yes stop_codon:yes gene_type:complete
MREEQVYNDRLFGYYDKLRRIAFSIGPASYADDLVHDTLEYFLKNKNEYINRPNLEALLVMKLKGINIDRWKSKSGTNFNELDSNYIRETLYGDDDDYEKIDRLSDFRKAFNELGEKCKEILGLTLDYSYNEIAEILELKPMTVGAQVSRCFSELKGIVK